MFWPTSTAVTTSPVGLVYLQLNSISKNPSPSGEAWVRVKFRYLLCDSLDHLNTGRHFKLEEGSLNSRVEANVRKDEFRFRAVGVTKQEAAYLIVCRIDLHDYL